MDERDWLAEQFEEHRTRLRAVAYRMLGSLSEADDAVQEAWIRLSRTDASQVENLGGWLTTVVARVSLNMLRSRDVRREEAIGVRVPEPIVDRADAMDPEHEAVLADSVGLALLVVLENLSPPGAARVRPARHFRHALRRDRAHRRPLARGSPPASQPRAAPSAGRVRGSRHRPCDTPEGRRSLPCSRTRGRLRGAARGAGPRRRAAGGSRPGRRIEGAPRGQGGCGPGALLLAARAWSRGRHSSTVPSAVSRPATESRSPSAATRSGAGRSSRSTSSPTRSGSGSSISRFSTTSGRTIYVAGNAAVCSARTTVKVQTALTTAHAESHQTRSRVSR